MSKPKIENWLKLETGALIDYLGKQRTLRLKKQAEVDDLKSVERDMTNILIDRLQTGKMDKAGGKAYNFSIKEVAVPDSVEDWHALHEWMKKEDAMDLLQRRLSVEACRLRWDAGVKIPGVRKILKIDSSLTSRKK